LKKLQRSPPKKKKKVATFTPPVQLQGALLSANIPCHLIPWRAWRGVSELRVLLVAWCHGGNLYNPDTST